MLRALLSLFFIIGFLIAGIPILGIEWIVGKFNPEKADTSQLRLVQAAFRILIKISGATVTVIGEEHIPPDEPVLYVGNHRGIFDIVITYARCPRLTGYISKDSMEKIPLLSIWMRRLHCLFLNREDIKEGLKTILAGIDNVKNGISMCIFPEGTRNRTDKLVLPFKKGSLKIAEKTGCAIIPMAITNSAEIFENHIPFIRPAHVIVEYGAPIYPKELDKETQKKLNTYCQDIICGMLEKNQKLV